MKEGLEQMKIEIEQSTKEIKEVFSKYNIHSISLEKEIYNDNSEDSDDEGERVTKRQTFLFHVNDFSATRKQLQLNPEWYGKYTEGFITFLFHEETTLYKLLFPPSSQ